MELDGFKIFFVLFFAWPVELDCQNFDFDLLSWWDEWINDGKFNESLNWNWDRFFKISIKDKIQSGGICYFRWTPLNEWINTSEIQIRVKFSWYQSTNEIPWWIFNWLKLRATWQSNKWIDGMNWIETETNELDLIESVIECWLWPMASKT